MAKKMTTAEQLNALLRNNGRGVPVVRWTMYGRWTADGLYVLDNLGNVSYKHPLAPIGGKP